MPQSRRSSSTRSSCKRLTSEQRGVAVFVPTRAGVEQLAPSTSGASGRARHRVLSRWRADPRPPAVPRGRGGASRIFLAMTAAGQSALNVRGLDTVVIDDVRYVKNVERGRNVLTGSTSAPTRSCRWRGGCTAASRAASVTSSATATSTSRRCAHGAGVPARRRRRARRDHVRRTRRGCRRPRAAGAARRARLSARDGAARDARHHREGAAHALRPGGRGDAGGARVGGAARQRRSELVPMLAVMRGIESLHRMTREERDLDGRSCRAAIISRRTTCYAEAVESVRQHRRGVRTAAPCLRWRRRSPSGRSGAACW